MRPRVLDLNLLLRSWLGLRLAEDDIDEADEDEADELLLSSLEVWEPLKCPLSWLALDR